MAPPPAVRAVSRSEAAAAPSCLLVGVSAPVSLTYIGHHGLWHDMGPPPDCFLWGGGFVRNRGSLTHVKLR